MSENIFERLSTQNKHLEYLKEFDNEVENNSDRGIVLICGSIIDELLTDLLKSFLIEKENIDKNLFNTRQPLGEFDAKLKLSFYLGLITELDYSNIVYIQRIRNKFAHQVIGISFENNDIGNTCSVLKIPKNAYIPEDIPYPEKETGKLPYVDLNPIKQNTLAKDRFIFTFRYLYKNLIHRTYLNEFERRKEYINSDAADVNSILMENKMKKMLEKTKELIEKENDLNIKHEKKLKREAEILQEKRGINVEEKFRDLEKQKTLREEKHELNKRDIEKTEEEYAPLFHIGDYVHAVIKNSMK